MKDLVCVWCTDDRKPYLHSIFPTIYKVSFAQDFIRNKSSNYKGPQKALS
jgi:hypothetical protein